MTRLDEHGWIGPLLAQDRRRPYRLMRAGLRVLGARLKQMRTVARVGHARLSEG